MAEAAFGVSCLVRAIQQYIGSKHCLPCTAKVCWKTCADCLQSPIAVLVHRDNLCEYSIRAGKVSRRVELKLTSPGKRSQKAHDFAATFCQGVLYMFGGLWGRDTSMTGVAKFNIQEGTWSWGAPMPTARSAACAVTFGSTIYVIGGRTGDMEPIEDDIRIVEKYATLEDEWVQAPLLRHPRAYCSALVVSSYIFVLGGCTSLSVEKLDLNDPLAWEDLPTKMPVMRNSGCVAVAVDRKIYVFGGWNRWGPNIARSASVLDLDKCTWTKLPRLPVEHSYFSQGISLDGSIYLFGASDMQCAGGINKYEPETGRWLTLPRCKEGREGCYLAFLGGPSHAPSTALLQEEERQPKQVQQVVDEVIQEVHHLDEAVAMEPAEAAAVVATQWAQQVELNLGASSTDFQTPGLLLKLLLLTFSRHPIDFQAALLEGPELQSCREQMQGLSCKLDCGALVFVEKFQYQVAIEAAFKQTGRLTAMHVITSERFEPNVMQATRGLRSRLNIRVKRKQTVLQPLEVQVKRTFLHVPDVALRSIASVTHSTTDAHGCQNPRTLA